MRQIKKLFLLTIMGLLLSIGAYGTTTNKGIKKSDTNVEVVLQTHFWDKVINAIIEVESEGNPNAKNGSSLGVLQITPIAVTECNNILKRRKSKRRYTLADRRSPKKSREIFIILQSEFNKARSVEKAIKCWNVGFFCKDWKNKGRNYYRKVMKHL